MLTRELAIEKVKSFTKEIISNGVAIHKVYLFGSFSKNTNAQNSDIDVALIGDNFIGFGYEDRKLFSKVNIKKEYIDIETVTFSSDYFQKGDPFINEIKNTGIEIYHAN